MPIRYICRKCGAILYEYTKISEQDPCGTLSPRAVAHIYNYVCPVCGSRLKSNTRNPDWREHIIIKPTKAKSKRGKQVRNSRTENTSEEIKGVRFITSTEFIIEEL